MSLLFLTYPSLKWGSGGEQREKLASCDIEAKLLVSFYYMQWFKFYGQDYLSDPKMLSLSASERSCWITLLCYSSVNDNGMITFLSEQQLMMQSGLDFQFESWDLTVGVLKKLENLGMITNDNGMITICNWQKRQGSSLTSYERVKKYREKKRNETQMITLEENRIEKKRRINTNTLQSKTIAEPDDVEIVPEEKPKTPKKKDYKKYDDETPFTLSEFVSSMESSPQRHVKIIGMYADTKQIKNSTKGQWRLFTDRNLASARRLSPYSDEQIARAFNEIEKNMKGSDNKKGYITRWTLETIEKYLEEI